MHTYNNTRVFKGSSQTFPLCFEDISWGGAYGANGVNSVPDKRAILEQVTKVL
jgi:hypothetical protein